ncbi:MAG: amino acid ABC transporter substrate-binding protein [Anaerolineae bacterium]|jgi:general L-amino acid transport system substrate-binding protein|nr:amino acid ABC transporter substrate-binding protein [Anaerolineae bacterium]
MGKKLFVFVMLLALSALMVAPLSAQDRPLGEITQRIIDRGSLICGVNEVLPGFGFKNEAGEFSGFDVDICKAVAAAILGDANAVTYRATTGAERPTVLASGEIDLLSRNTTWTLSRDVDWGTTFAPTAFYDGQGVMVRTDSGIATLEDLAGGIICTNAGTTTELNITDAMQSRGLEFTLQTFQEFNGAMAAFNEGGCDAVTTDISGLVSTKGSSADPGSYAILDVVLSKEPLGPLSPQSDAQFADIVRWVVYGLIQAEEFGITSENVDSFLTSEDPSIQRFLGLGENLSGTYLGIPNDFMVTVIRSVGNYGEIYERNLTTPFGLARGVNALWTDGGLMYSPPFR